MTTVEILSFAGCPNHAPTADLVREVVHDVAPQVEVREVEIADDEQAQRLHFLGSPSVRVNGRDVEPGAEDRTSFQIACRLYRPGFDRRWVEAALREAQP